MQYYCTTALSNIAVDGMSSSCSGLPGCQTGSPYIVETIGSVKQEEVGLERAKVGHESDWVDGELEFEGSMSSCFGLEESR